LGVRASLFTLTRGEGGQNAMSADTYDALGLMRTNELLKATEYYGAKQLWGTEADFGFSKTQEESFARWGHDRVLYDAVLAVRQERPQVIVATFAGAVSDGHGQHQVSGEIAQEVFKAAGDRKVFPEQLKDGLEPWQPLFIAWCRLLR
jgi:LmbE family N-acetylglucosaminyl deacetylase